MGKMLKPAGAKKSMGTRPKPKSKNKKSVGKSLMPSSGTRKTAKGARKGRVREEVKTGATTGTPKGAQAKKGTVRGRPKKGMKAVDRKSGSRRKESNQKDPSTKSKRTRKRGRPVSASRGRNSPRGSSRTFGQR